MWLYFKYFTQEPMFTLHLSVKHLLTAASFILCAKPANIIIKNVFEYNKLKTVEDDLLNAGKIIGVMERFVTLALILMCQYEAVGLKSIQSYTMNGITICDTI